MSELVQAFTLGNAAILANVCLLPLYPGLIAFLAGNANTDDGRSHHATKWLGLLVLLGILSMMTLIGFILYTVQQSFDSVLLYVLPLIYGLVILLGLLMFSGRNPFAKLATVQAPILSNRYATAYVYGLLFGPMTLPCTGPIIFSAFALGAGSTGALLDGLAYFFAFGLGFGWPLVILPFFAIAAQRRFTQTLTRNHTLLTRVSGTLLVIIGVFGIVTELIPNL